MKTPQEEIEALELQVQELRSVNTPEAHKYADNIAIKVALVKQRVDRMESLTMERLVVWFIKILEEVEEKGYGKHDIDAWKSERLRAEVFEGMQVAWAACRFRRREAAEMMGVPDGLVYDWMHSEGWKVWLDEADRRQDQTKAIADMAMQRAGFILAIDSNDIDVVKVQAQTIKTILSSGLTVHKQLPGPKAGRNARQGLPPAVIERPARSIPAPKKKEEDG